MKSTIKVGPITRIRKLIHAIGLTACITLMGCEDIMDSISDCIVNKHPNLPVRQLTDGKVSQPYHEVILASMDNEPYDDDYHYYFDISGQMPQGINARGEGRTLIFMGNPMQNGVYTIKVNLRVVSFNGDAGLCTNKASRTYTIAIME